ncbi:MAG: hypothetical protein IPM55_04015 [Acidobacteria bacterium]|nr:hypothetical protein [Acidobacteriota bacterium]
MTNQALFRRLKVSRNKILLMLLLFLSGAMNILLSAKVNSQKHELVSAREWGFGVGRTAQPLRAHNLNGVPASVPLTGDVMPTVVYVYSPQCIWSSRNIDNINTLIRETKGKYKFVGLALSDASLDQYILKNNLSIPTFKMPDKCSKGDLRVVGTPQTIVLSKKGQILKNWYGAYSGSLKTEVENYFGLTLPGTIR